ncbi:RHS repeat-associated core domain-containing protein [Fulvivirgaceae bacterium PWU4]|uniref:RHS repeat-associated core domain-containing protein n=1 Tax=Chryseosolibacter histidini TaxID=2782349 RepID=A0AAP2GPD8_9BACT|nr:DUF6443 domain-containing protein [Chryseosolibacter histidini]MBT1699008.1 RHS repeat-associated core domain-containing protein [Chryseosolibacter histidini]
MLVCLNFYSASAQVVGETVRYSYLAGTTPVPQKNGAVTSPNGVIVGSSRTFDSGTQEYTEHLDVRWDIKGPATVELKSGSANVIYTWNVTVSCGSGILPTVDYVSKHCGPAEVPISVTPAVAGSEVRWYYTSSPTETTPFLVGTSYSPTVSSTTTYYVSTYSSYSLCETARKPVTITINPFPGAPTTAGTFLKCGPGTITLSGSPGSNANSLRWYDDTETLLPVVAPGLSYQPDLTETTSFFISSYSTSTGCESQSKIPIQAVIGSVPAKPENTTDDWIYGSGSVKLSVAIADPALQVQWFTNPAATGTPAATGSQITTSMLSTTTPYYVRSVTPEGCASDTAWVYARVVTNLVSPSNLRSEAILQRDVKDDTQANALNLAGKQTQQVYFDGMGRPVQTVVYKGSPMQKDVVQPVEYDGLGRSSKQYLPYANGADGSYKSAYRTDQLSFYNASNDKIINDSVPYAVSEFEKSPMGRLLKQGGPGKLWQPETTHANRVAYSYNTGAVSDALEEVRKFNADGSSTGFYAANKLNRIQTTDADGLLKVVFTDSEGRTIARKDQLQETIDNVMVSWLETYYIYDDLGQVRYMIPPKGVAALKSAGWTLTQTLKDNHTHQFLYDARGRIVEKKVPGQAPMYYVYDQLNRLVLSQDGILRADKKWIFIKYDRAGRPVIQGLYKNTTQTTRADVQDLLTPLYKTGNNEYPENAWFETRASVLHGYSNNCFPKTNSDNSALEIQIVNFYDGYDFDDADAVADFAYVNQSLPGEDKQSQGGGYGMPTGSKKLVLGSNTWLYSYIFYDQAGRAIQVRSGNHLNPSALDDLATLVYAFDGRVLCRKTYHNAGAGKQTTVVNTYEYDHAGRLKRVYQNNNNASSSQLVAMYQYNEAGQLVAKKLHKTGGYTITPDPSIGQPGVTYSNEINAPPDAVQPVFVAKTAIRLKPGFTFQGTANDKFKARIGLSEADALVFNESSEQFMQVVDYRYDIRGMLTSINNAALNVDENNGDTNDYFGMELLYNGTDSGLGNTGRFNGNISAVKWKVAGTTTGVQGQKSYTFAYDKSNKLKTANFRARGAGAWDVETGVHNESVAYDHNGNINTLQRNQRKHQLSPSLIASYTAETMDDLTFSYNAGAGDRLEKVQDASGKAAGFKNGTNDAGSVDYTYDINGNVTADDNKGIQSITYNYLGKPSVINFTDGRKIEYTYDAVGTKLTMKTFQGASLQSTTDYAGAFVYENGTLSFFSSPEGRVVKKGSELEYQYSIADHQGNTRVVFSSATPSASAKTTDFESSTNTDFQNYPVSAGARSSLPLFNKTPGGTYSQMLKGSTNSQIGVARSFKVYPGDKVKIEAYAKYFNPTANSSNLGGYATALLGAFQLPTPAPGETGTPSSGLNTWGSAVATGGGPGNTTYPKAFVNILLFDKDFNFLDVAYDQINGGEQVNESPNVPHDQMMKEYTVKEAGYAFVYISNDNPTQVEVYFDDVTITHTPTNIIQYNEYYPFGLQAATSWTRENNKNDYLYNAGTELNAISGWYETFFRSYDPVLGRFMQIDPMASVTHTLSPYQYADCNPVLFNDPSGLLRAPRDLNSADWSGWTSFVSGGGGGVSRVDWSSQYRDVDANAMFMFKREFNSYYGIENDRDRFDFAREVGTTVYEDGKLTSAVGVNGIGDGNGNIIPGTEEYIIYDQQGGQEWFRTFLMENFGDEIRGLNRLAKESGQRLAWWIDAEGKYASDPGIPGDTRRIKERNTTYVSIHAYPLAKAMAGDPRLLYVVVAHELVHATDIINGNRDFWYDWYGEIMGHQIMEHHAYTRSAEIEKQMGVNFGGAMGLFKFHVTEDYLNLR